jgi:hypothetical protein
MQIRVISYMNVPDLSWSTDNTGERIPLGNLVGHGCIIPFVRCLLRPNDRMAVESCVECKYFEELRANCVICSFSTTHVESGTLDDAIKEKKKTLKTPLGVYTP